MNVGGFDCSTHQFRLFPDTITRGRIRYPSIICCRSEKIVKFTSNAIILTEAIPLSTIIYQNTIFDLADDAAASLSGTTSRNKRWVRSRTYATWLLHCSMGRPSLNRPRYTDVFVDHIALVAQLSTHLVRGQSSPVMIAVSSGPRSSPNYSLRAREEFSASFISRTSSSIGLTDQV